MKSLLTMTLETLHRHRRSMLSFYLFFSGLAVVVVLPAISVALSLIEPLTGDAAITTGGILTFILSAGGLAWVLVTVTLSVLLLLLQQAGMTLIASTAPGKDYRRAISAIWSCVRNLGGLCQLAVIKVLGHLLIATPFLAAVALAWQVLLSDYDSHYLLSTMPADLWLFMAVAVPAMVGVLFCNGRLYLHWALAVPLLVVEKLPASRALSESRALIRGHRRQLIGILVPGLLVVVLTPVAITFFFDLIGELLFSLLPPRKDILLPVVLLFVASYLLLGLAVTIFTMAAYSTLVYSVFQRVSNHSDHPQPDDQPPSLMTGSRISIAEVTFVCLAIFQAAALIHNIELEDTVSITAHRGSAFKSPENTLAAVDQAIDDGADFIEIDVQLTRDHVPVLWHDTDMQRIFGRTERISDVYYPDIATLDAGSWFGEDFSDQRIATLEEVIALVADRANLFVDLKPDRNSPELVTEVINVLREQNALDGTIVAAADWATLSRVREQSPEVQTALLAQFIIGPVWREQQDILGLRFNRVTSAAVARAHQNGRELHVWTVNQPEDMERFIDMGVDNIITDRPDVLRDILNRRSRMSDGELLAWKVRNWLR
ncbi:glycerophosphodiester phosphodiesterase [Marinobacter sp.]|uniref:glycerophosphodiester phosphodiesterase n=1 Tax=Marinobacter sp. TaxID=50741 RepID=UPI00356212E5